MPENPSQSQYEKQEDAIASIQQQLSEEEKRETGRNDGFTLGESAKLKKLKSNEKIKDRQNGEAAKLTVESTKAQSGESAQSEMEIPTPPQNSKNNKDSIEENELKKESASEDQNNPESPSDTNGEESERVKVDAGVSNEESAESKKKPRPGRSEKKPRPSRGETSMESPKQSSEDNRTGGKAHVQNSTEDAKTSDGGTEEELPNNREAIISKIISAGDPVLLNGVKDFGTPGAWFYTGDSEIITDRSGKGTNHKSQVKIIFKQPGGEVTDEQQVTWSEITPAYNSDEEYTHALRTIREKYEQVKEQSNNEVYEKHLAKLGAQMLYFSLRFNQRQKHKIKQAKAVRNAA